jgi:hypothetical protein
MLPWSHNRKEKQNRRDIAVSKIENLRKPRRASNRAQDTDSPRKKGQSSANEEEYSRILVRYIWAGPKKNSVTLKKKDTVNEIGILFPEPCSMNDRLSA